MPPPSMLIPLDGIAAAESARTPPIDGAWPWFIGGGSFPALSALISGSLETSIDTACSSSALARYWELPKNTQTWYDRSGTGGADLVDGVVDSEQLSSI